MSCGIGCLCDVQLGFKWTVLVGRERMAKSVMATSLPEKGGHGKFGRDKVLEFLEENGDAKGDVII